jgi:hypothetical protein
LASFRSSEQFIKGADQVRAIFGGGRARPSGRSPKLLVNVFISNGWHRSLRKNRLAAGMIAR